MSSVKLELYEEYIYILNMRHYFSKLLQAIIIYNTILISHPHRTIYVVSFSWYFSLGCWIRRRNITKSCGDAFGRRIWWSYIFPLRDTLWQSIYASEYFGFFRYVIQIYVIYTYILSTLINNHHHIYMHSL